MIEFNDGKKEVVEAHKEDIYLNYVSFETYADDTHRVVTRVNYPLFGIRKWSPWHE